MKSLLCLFFTLVAACGQKGPLVLPEENKQQTTPPTTIDQHGTRSPQAPGA